MSFVSEALVISGVALDLVGATVLSHAHNAESALELREEIGGDERALGEKDAVATHAQLLSEKRVGFLILAFGLSLYLTGLVLKSPEGVVRPKDYEVLRISFGSCRSGPLPNQGFPLNRGDTQTTKGGGVRP
ncbi:MAG: hypothetical protein LC781_00330 [Actinobacteria bacterium]|nr:hypothetical protein [Actinomycetota bacterium]